MAAIEMQKPPFQCDGNVPFTKKPGENKRSFWRSVQLCTGTRHF
ncbi:hypothetical protein [uncultured Desulfosarcina sp.]|nr:hypothetical protein [uncultured Desulfosarcina sp.]